MNIHDRRGYTLMELVITTLVIGILASFAIPAYLKSIETSKYDDAVGLVNQIGMTNRMFALDHSGYYVEGAFTGSGCSCTSTSCTTMLAAFLNASGQVNATVNYSGSACPLVCCNYLGDQNWAGKPYNFFACDPVLGGGGGACQTTAVSDAQRVASGTYGTGISPYTGWGAWMNTSGVITGIPATGSAGAAPNPTY
jgi:prepilin-type N-terminal cleavage/methylation domain-containing protein